MRLRNLLPMDNPLDTHRQHLMASRLHNLPAFPKLNQPQYHIKQLLMASSPHTASRLQCMVSRRLLTASRLLLTASRSATVNLGTPNRLRIHLASR